MRKLLPHPLRSLYRAIFLLRKTDTFFGYHFICNIESDSWYLSVFTSILALLFIVKCQPLCFDPNGSDIFGRRNTCTITRCRWRKHVEIGPHDCHRLYSRTFILTFDRLFVSLLTFTDLFESGVF